MPPSITTFAPIIKLHSSEDMNKAAFAISSEAPKRLIGCNFSDDNFILGRSTNGLLNINDYLNYNYN